MFQVLLGLAAAGVFGCVLWIAYRGGGPAGTSSRSPGRAAAVAGTDPLTGLPNRAELERHLAALASRHTRRGGAFCIALLDLDRFKSVNDRHGHAAGDALLARISQRLQESVSSGDFLARLGGDEFVAVRAPCASEAQALSFAGVLSKAVTNISASGGSASGIGASIGLALFPQHGETPAKVLHRADLAMFRAKSAGRNGFCLHDSAQERLSARRARLSKELPQALEDEQLSVRYQPQFDAAQKCVGFEALLRWSHPRMGEVAPAEFIPIAESTQQIGPITEWLLTEACAEAAAWERPLSIAINISGQGLGGPDLPRMVHESLQASGLSPERLELEITEEAFVDDDPAKRASLQRLKALGARLVLDDFGAGTAALTLLHKVEFDRINIDRSLIADVAGSRTAAATIAALIALANNLGVRSLAEGIETDSQAKILKAAGIGYLQGHHFGQPMPIEQARLRFGLTSRPADPITEIRP